MPNRDHDESQYNRNEGRFESRDDWRDQGNAGAREWDRRDDELRALDHGAGYGLQRGHQPGSFEERRDQRLAQQDFGRGGYGQDRQDFRGHSAGPDWSRQQGGYNSQDWRSQGPADPNRFANAGPSYGHDWRSQQYGRSQGGQTPSGHLQSQSYGQDWRGQEHHRPQRFDQTGYSSQSGGYRQHTQDWDRSPYVRPDFSRTQSNHGGRDANRTEESHWGGSSQSYGGQLRGDQGRDDESWGQQLRHAGQQAARSIKRVFRGPKNYRRSDERIREDVSDRLGLQDALDPSEIEVSVTNGEVTLSGTVQLRREKYFAEEIADDVSGVNEVNNQIRVRREDTSITSAATSGTSASTTTESEGTQRNRNARA